MKASLNSQRRTCSSRARLLVLTALFSGVLVAGCGGSSLGLNAETVSGTTSATAAGAGSATIARSSTTAGGAKSSGSTVPGPGSTGPLAFARCMRANGVPNFPDPSPDGGFTLAGIDPSAPAFRAARAKCHGFLGSPVGPGAPSFSPQVKAQSLAKLLKIAVCMRAHGISEFPDPRTTRPSNLADTGAGVITDFDGVFLVFPATLNLQAPTYKRALAACGAPPLGLRHG